MFISVRLVIEEMLIEIFYTQGIDGSNVDVWARTTDAYRDGLRGFMAAAEAHMLGEGRGDTCCPCKDCGNIRIFELRHIQSHLVKRGFMEGYLRWTKHGEDEA